MLDNQIEYDDPLSLHAVVWWIETWGTFSMPLSLLGMGGRNYVALLKSLITLLLCNLCNPLAI
jgi:hypothetical protein